MKTKIINLSHDAMFKAVFSSNKNMLAKLVQAILDYYKINIKVDENNLELKRNELDIENVNDKQLICDYVVKINDNFDLNIEINREIYSGLYERNLIYSFKIYGSHFKSGDSYNKFNSYDIIQANLNRFNNSNGKCINCFYIIDINDVRNVLSNHFTVLNIDIASCFDLVYNNSKLEEILPIHAFGAIMHCNYLEEISSILEKGRIKMTKKEKEKFLNDVKVKSQDKNVIHDIKIERTVEDRYKWIEGCTRYAVTEEVTKEVTNDMIKAMLKKGLSLEDISDISKCSIEEIKKISKEVNSK